MRPRSKNPKRNAVAVRFDDDDLAAVEAAAAKDQARISPWVRDAAIEKAREKQINVTTHRTEIVSVDPDGFKSRLPNRGEKGQA